MSLSSVFGAIAGSREARTGRAEVAPQDRRGPEGAGRCAGTPDPAGAAGGIGEAGGGHETGEPGAGPCPTGRSVPLLSGTRTTGPVRPPEPSRRPRGAAPCGDRPAPPPLDGGGSRSPDPGSLAASAPGRASLPRRFSLRRRLRPRENAATLLRGARAAALALLALAALSLAAAENAAAQSVVLSPTSLDVPEAGSASYTVKLATLPTAEVTVSIGGTSGTDLSLSRMSLTFTTSNWDTAQMRDSVGGAGLGRDTRQRHPDPHRNGRRLRHGVRRSGGHCDRHHNHAGGGCGRAAYPRARACRSGRGSPCPWTTMSASPSP